jgi:cyclopropane-fatty-acyl-phospholipid synthase
MSKVIVLKLFKLVGIKTYEQYPQNYDIKVIDHTFYSDLLNYKTLGLGEAYMSGKFTTLNLEILLTKLQRINTLNIFAFLRLLQWQDYLYLLKYICFYLINLCIPVFTNPQDLLKSRKVAEIHYDLPPILYEKMLDPTMLYSCAYWNEVKSLDEAQLQKTELIIQKLKIKDGDRILEIGSGFGFIAYRIAKRFPNCDVFGISISKEQVAYCNQKYDLPNLKFQLQDYRELQKNSYDKIYHVGFFEHLGYKNYQDFFDITFQLLKNNGIMLAHTVTKHKESYNCDPWINKYIFPGGYLPSMSQVLKVVENIKFNIADLQEFGPYYALTLEAWLQNFQQHFESLRDTIPTVFTTKFYRMWEFYLIMSKVGFTSSHLHLTQFVFTKNYGVYIR